MIVSAVLTLGPVGHLVPLCRTRRPNVVRQVALAALEEVKEAASGESDAVLAALLQQEAERLAKGLRSLGLDVEARNG